MFLKALQLPIPGGVGLVERVWEGIRRFRRWAQIFCEALQRFRVNDSRICSAGFPACIRIGSRPGSLRYFISVDRGV